MIRKLCCTLNVHIYCYYCKKQWCSPCWHSIFTEDRIWKEPMCPHYPDAKGTNTTGQGNHYTMCPGDEEPSPADLKDHAADVADAWASYIKRIPWEKP